MASISGSINIVLPLPHAAEQGAEGSSVNLGQVAATLKLLVVNQTGAAGTVKNGSAAVTLNKVRSSITGTEGTNLNKGVLQVILPKVAVHSYLAHQISGAITVSLKKVACSITGVDVKTALNTGIMGCTLKRTVFISTGYVVDSINAITLVWSSVRSGATGLLQFKGPPKRAIQWTLGANQGSITPIQNSTDNYGLAYARYDPGAFTGFADISVTYGT